MRNVSVGLWILMSMLVSFGQPAAGQADLFGQYQVDSLLSETYRTQLDTLTAALASWNRARGAFQDGRFIDIQGTPGALDLLRRSWNALESGQLGTLREIEGQIALLQPRTAIVPFDGKSWVGVGFLYTQGSWNGIRFSKPDRVRQNFDSVVVGKLLGLFNQAPKAGQLAGILLHYSYVYYNSISRPQTHFGEEIQFRIPTIYLDQFLNLRITTDQLLGGSVIIVKSHDEQVPQRIQLGIPPPQSVNAPSPVVTQTLPSPSSEQFRARAVRETAAGKEVGVVLVGDVVLFRISTPFEGKTPLQRAEIVAEKLTRLIGQGLRADEVRQGALAGRYVVMARNEVLVTIDTELAKNNGTSSPALAALWASRIRTTLSQIAPAVQPLVPSISPSVRAHITATPVIAQNPPTSVGIPKPLPHSRMAIVTRELSQSTGWAAVVKVGGIEVFRIQTSFGGHDPFQRADASARVLNRLIGQGLRPEEVRTGVREGQVVLLGRSDVIVVVDGQSARLNGMSSAQLASQWAANLRRVLR